MPAPFGNQFWKLVEFPGTQKKLTPQELWDKAMDLALKWEDSNPYVYFDYVGKDGQEIEREKSIPYTQKGLCLFVGMSEETFRNYGRKEGYEEYFEVYTRIKDIIDRQKFVGASIGIFNSSIIARDLGLVDKAQTTTDGKQEIVVRYERKPDSNAE